jgi:hypothetical protein
VLKIDIPAATSSPTWRTLESFIREQVQTCLQRVLEEEVDARHERRAADAAGYRHGLGLGLPPECSSCWTNFGGETRGGLTHTISGPQDGGTPLAVTAVPIPVFSGVCAGVAWTRRRWAQIPNDTGVGDPRAANAQSGTRS